jgi:hypothetical protein
MGTYLTKGLHSPHYAPLTHPGSRAVGTLLGILGRTSLFLKKRDFSLHAVYQRFLQVIRLEPGKHTRHVFLRNETACPCEAARWLAGALGPRCYVQDADCCLARAERWRDCMFRAPCPGPRVMQTLLTLTFPLGDAALQGQVLLQRCRPARLHPKHRG